jgi:hypothetical protein
MSSNRISIIRGQIQNWYIPYTKQKSQLFKYEVLLGNEYFSSDSHIIISSLVFHNRIPLCVSFEFPETAV